MYEEIKLDEEQEQVILFETKVWKVKLKLTEELLEEIKKWCVYANGNKDKLEKKSKKKDKKKKKK